MVLSSTDLPAPEPPTTPMHLAAPDGQVQAVVDDVVVERETRPRTSIGAARLVGAAAAHMFSFM